MQRRFLLVLALASAAACSDATGPLRPPGTDPPDAAGLSDAGGGGGAGLTRRPGLVRVATFNVRRYFDTMCDTGRCGTDDFEELPSQVTFEAMTGTVATGIALIDPDVIVLQEIETSKCLAALVAKLASLGLDFPIAHLGEIGTPGSVDVAVLARGTLGEIKTHRETRIPLEAGGTTTFSRELLEVRMTFGARSLVIFGAHFRSKVDDDPARRLAEGKGARALVAKTATDLPDSIVLLAGDLNDTPGSPPLNALEEGGALVRVAKDVSPDNQSTYTFQGQKTAIDHVYVGSNQASRYVPASATSYRDDPTRNGFAGSDHSALGADFTID